MDVVNPSPSETEPFLDPKLDHFELLGLERGFRIDRDRLERQYLALSAKYHPDKHVGAPTSVRRKVMEISSALNEAYRTLRSPTARAEYLCQLMGIDLDSSDPQGGAPAMDQAFLVRMLDEREQMAEAKDKGPMALDEFREHIEVEADSLLDAAVGALDGEEVEEAARKLVARRYLQRLLDEVDAPEAT